MRFIEYAGMNYQQASREGSRLVDEAHKTGNWFVLIERLADLREIMKRDRDAA